MTTIQHDRRAPVRITPTQLYVQREEGQGSVSIEEMGGQAARYELADQAMPNSGEAVVIQLRADSDGAPHDTVIFHVDNFDRIETLERAMIALWTTRRALDETGYEDLGYPRDSVPVNGKEKASAS
jgi:hypothetical protein